MMWVAVLFTELLIAFLGITRMHMSVGPSILVIGISAVTLALHALILRKIPGIINSVILGIVACVAGIILYCTPAVAVKTPIDGYYNAIVEIESRIMEEDLDAEDDLEDLEGEYGKNDSTKGLHAVCCIMRGDRDKAYEYIEDFENKKSIQYYARMELFYQSDLSRDTTSDIYALYDQMVQDCPQWEYAQRMAGISQVERGNYTGADYFLTAALELEPEDIMALYYLGVSAYQQGRYEECNEYFLRAIDAGAEDEMLSWMAWYEEKMGAEQAALGQEETADTQNSEAGEAEGERKGEQE